MTRKDLYNISSNSIINLIEEMLENGHEIEATDTLNKCLKRVQEHDVSIDGVTNTSYTNTIDVQNQVPYPGDLQRESKIQDIIRWNAMAMVVKANRVYDGLGGHISSYASIATIYEVGFNHVFRGNSEKNLADQVFFQGHTSPGIYSRAYMEGRLTPKHLHNFRQELSSTGGLSSYPHPYLMPNFWQFPTVSMGLGPILSIYQARFNRYLMARKIISPEQEPRVFCFIGDGECDEPETLGALSIAAREKLDNLTFIINCNLQRLDGPVRGNSKIIQELEAVFVGAGWNVIKVVWGSNWDELLNSKHKNLLIKRMQEAVDGDYQKYVVEPGSYFRKHFFGKYPELLDLVNHLTDNDLKNLLRGGHDPIKVYSAYSHALEHVGRPTVILAKTVKGYGLGEAGEGKNISHQQKKLNEKELREFREKLAIPISDEKVVDAPFYRPNSSSEEIQYLLEKRTKLGGFIPERKVEFDALELPKMDDFKEFLVKSRTALSTTMGFVRILSKLLRNPKVGNKIVPIIPDEARTFGMESFFKQYGIYSHLGQLYEPVDFKTIIYYREAKDGQILEEGINESGAMSSFIAAATSYSTHGKATIPFYIYYSMFGFQRIGDLMWLAADMQAKGFLLGATAGRTALNGEGLQHQDGHSLLLASTIPTLNCYDPAFMYEIAIIISHGLTEMYDKNKNEFYYLTLANENYLQPEMPKGVEEGVIKGLYKFVKSSTKNKLQSHIFASGSTINLALEAKRILESDYNISVDVWSATNYKKLRADAINCDRLIC
jgi:pyruvate dehydrogenase E1 component